MKTTVQFNKGNEQIEVTNADILAITKNKAIIDYIACEEDYAEFCKNQTKTGQSRKNERARARNRMFLKANFKKEDFEERQSLIKSIFAKKDALIDKVTVEIEFDGRKKSNLSKIIAGVEMAYFVGGISPQYYDLGLISFKIKTKK